ncbi:MAG: glucose-1-phosphate adenylyltransferase, partial [Oscillospiraceae bacterium]|nr:glucose-1-phosphate adenylyltransferase [Oscillospiraceae bacterium]
RKYLIEDEADPNSSNDFGKNIIPTILNNGETMLAYRFQGYWKDVGTIDSLWDANMDLLDPKSGFDVYDPEWTIYTRSAIRPPQYVGPNAKMTHSIATSGCEIWGTVEESVLFHSVTVEEGATVRYSILMPGAVVKKGAVVEYAIIAENTVIGENAHVGEPPAPGSAEKGIAVVAQDLVVGSGAVVGSNAMITENIKGVEA